MRRRREGGWVDLLSFFILFKRVKEVNVKKDEGTSPRESNRFMQELRVKSRQKT
jgi:hypothetical protein